jgi:hypothetical protein
MAVVMMMVGYKHPRLTVSGGSHAAIHYPHLTTLTEFKMTEGIGTYGTKRGRPPKKSKKVVKKKKSKKKK